jgi:hypothetical protein
MEFVGKWIVKKTMYPTEEGVKHLTKEELVALGADMDDLRMFDSVIVVKDDGTIETLVQVPADQIEEAKAQGAPVDENGCILVETSTWKEENGAYLYEISGETVPFKLTEDGLLEYAMGMMLLEKF